MCSFPLVPVYSCLFPFVCLFPSLFGLRSRSFEASIRTRLCPLTPLARSRLFTPLICACSRLCPFVWPPFALVCAHLPRLFVLSFVLVRTRSVVCSFSLRASSVPAHPACSFVRVPVCARLCGPRSRSFVPARPAYQPSFVSVSNIWLVHTY